MDFFVPVRILYLQAVLFREFSLQTKKGQCDALFMDGKTFSSYISFASAANISDSACGIECPEQEEQECPQPAQFPLRPAQVPLFVSFIICLIQMKTKRISANITTMCPNIADIFSLPNNTLPGKNCREG